MSTIPPGALHSQGIGAVVCAHDRGAPGTTIRPSRSTGRKAKGMSDRVLLGDIGGTNARFALLDGGVIRDITHLKVADFPSIIDAITDFLSRHAAGGPPTA